MNSEKVEEYTKRFQKFFAVKLCFTREDLQEEHARLLKSLLFNDPVKPMHMLNHTKTKIDQIFLDFVQENDENLARFESLKKRGETNCIRKFQQIEENLVVNIQANLLNFSFNVTQEELQHFVDTSVQLLPENWKEHLSAWYFQQIKEFLDDIQIVLSMISHYKENLQKQISSQHPICIEATDFQTVHAQSFAVVQEVDLNHLWTHKKLNQHAYTAIKSIWKICFNENSKIIEEEKKLIEQALETTLELYKGLMSSKINGGTLLGQSKIENIHRLCTKAIEGTFFNLPNFPYSYLWSREVQEKLTETLQQQLAHYVEQGIVDTTKNVGVITPRAFGPGTAVSKPTATVHANPVTFTSNPATFTSNPATFTSNPATFTSNPATFTSNPATFTSNPATVTANPATANASLKTSTPTGIGLYLNSTGTRLGIYQGQGRDPIYVKFPPFLTFGGNCGSIMSELPDDWEAGHSIHIYKALTAGTSERRTLPIFNDFASLLRTEEIAAIYFSQIKARADELTRGAKVNSCVVSLSAFIPRGSKQMLKDALKLAGFDQCIIIQATTAIGISYIHSYSAQFKTQNRAVLIHLTSSQFEVAVADVNPLSRSLEIRRVNSDQYYDKTTNNNIIITLLMYPINFFNYIFNRDNCKDLNSKLKTSISSMFSSLDVKHDRTIRYVVCCGGSRAVSVGSKVISGKSFDSPSCVLNEDEGIVFGAAVLDAMKHDRNMNLSLINYKEASVDEFIPPPGASRAMGMTSQEFESASEKLKNLFKLWEGNTAGNSGFKHFDQPLVRSKVSPETLSNINSRTELAKLVSVIKRRLESPTELNPMIVSIIEDGLKKSEEVLENPDTKGREIEGLVRQMEFAASQFIV